MAKRPVRLALYGCEHQPFTPKATLDWVCKTLREFKPDVVCHLGDRFNADAASVHPGEFDHDQLDEYEAAARASEQVRAAAGKRARLVWLLGNHDDNLQSPDPRRLPKALRRLGHWNKSEWGPEFRRWEQVPYEKSARGTFRLGQIVAYHGYDCGETSDELEALQFNNYTGGMPHRLFVRAHTHRPLAPFQLCRTRRIALPYWAANVGTIGPLKPKWASRQDTGRWAPSVLLVEMARNFSPTCRNWTAELRTPSWKDAA